MNAERLGERLEPYSLSFACFSHYVEECVRADSALLEEHDLIAALENNDSERLQIVEDLLRRAANLLELGDAEFARAFGFCRELNVRDPERIHDLLAEPFTVCELADLGFSSIRKLPRWIKKQGKKLQNADLFAVRNSTKFVIEVKVIRQENRPKPKPGELIGDAMQPSWWSRMLFNNANTKIRDKNFRVLKQLENAKNEYGADKAMLVLHTRRTSALLIDNEDYLEVMKKLRLAHPQIDFLTCKDRFGSLVVVPQLEDI